MVRIANVHWIHIVLLVISLSSVTNGFFVVFRQSNTTKAFYIPYENLDIDASNMNVPPPNHGTNLWYYRNISARYSADERCLTGLPLGAAIYTFHPYASFEMYPYKTWNFLGLAFHNIFPDLLKKGLVRCCHPNSSVEFVKLLTTQNVATSANNETAYDFTLPMYGDSMDDTTYKGNAFIPLLQAPSVALIVFSDDSKKGNTKLIVTTILRKFPLLLFILLTASTSGIVIWFLDHKTNKEEFTDSFGKGAWEGFWWAFITMTTVGYGDRTPRTLIGRIFCCIWIIFGVVTFSIFSGLITANIYASTQNNFEIRGAKIGTSGKREFKLGVSLNANMSVFESSLVAFGKLLNKEIDGVLVDNYAATYFGSKIAELKLRRDRMIDYPITYGIMLGKNTSYIGKCVRKFIMDNPQLVFENVRKSLHPKKNKADSENLRLKEAKKLFYQDDTFERIIEIEAIVLGALLSLGIIYQLSCYLLKKRGGNKEGKYTNQLVQNSKWRLGSFKRVDNPVDDLIEQYKRFENGWKSKFVSLQQD